MKRFLAVLVIGSALALRVDAGATDASKSRVEPSRPPTRSPERKPLTWTTFDGMSYLSSGQIAAYLDLKSGWLEPSHKLLLTDRTTQVQLDRDRIEAQVNGLGVRLGNPPVFRDGMLYVSRIDFERYLIPRIRPGLIGPPPARPRLIVIDPGHGGKDNGMENVALGLREKVLALDVAQRLQKRLEAAGFRVALTRTGDAGPIFKDLPQRAKFANELGADLFVSVHFNSLYPDTKTNGTETYLYTPQSQRSTSSHSAGQPADIRTEALPINKWDGWSALLADRVHREVVTRLKTADRGQKTKHLLVLQDLKCPAILVESVFVSNDAEARRAAQPAFREEIANAIFAGIRSYVAVIEDLRAPEVRVPVTTVAGGPSNSPN